MEEAGLARISLLFSVAGLVGLFLVSSSLTGEVVGVGELRPEDVGRAVTVQGNVTSKHISRAGHVFLRVDDGTSISVVVFNNTVKKVGVDLGELDVGSGVKVSGRLETYKGGLEIIAEGMEYA